MKIDQLDFGNISYQTIKLISSTKIDFNRNSEVNLFKVENKYFIKDIKDEKKVSEIQGVDKKGHQNIEKVTSLNLPKISFIADNNKLKKENILTIQTNEFIGKIEQDLDIALTEDVLSKAKKSNKNLKTINDLSSWLNDQCVLNSNKIFSIIKDEKKDDGNSFIILGRSIKLFVKKKLKEENEFYYLNKITRKIGKNDRDIIRIIEGNIKFCDESTVGKIKAETLAMMEEIKKSEESYINTWKKYQKIETEFVLENMRNIGELSYNKVEMLPDGKVRIDILGITDLSDLSKYIDIGTRLEISEFSHPLLADLKIDWFEYSENKKNKQYSKREVILCELEQKIKTQQTSIFIKLGDVEDFPKIPEKGIVNLSISGTEIRTDRQNIAIENILLAKSPMPHLPLIIEGKSPSIPRRKTVEPVSQKVKDKIFPEYPPTLIQKEAIDIALNTPDIAIIQGPPGTGKTTVITAIIERLNEINNSFEDISGNYLVSGFQHDAVENAIDRIEVNGLPTPKFGKKSGQIDDPLSLIDRKLNNWRLEKKASLEKTIPSIRENAFYKKFINLSYGYFLSPGDVSETSKMLENCKTILKNNISSNLMNKLNNKIEELASELFKNDTSKIEEVLKTIWRIPTNKTIYSDDGQNSLMKIILRLKTEKCLDNDHEKQLKSFIFKSNLKNEEFDKLKEIQRKLLIKNTPSEKISLTPKNRDDINELLSKIKIELDNKKSNSSSNSDNIIAEYFNELENNPLEVERAIKDYNAVYGATCGQAMGKQISDFKSSDSFDTVMVDEAARSNPLDLFIPMSLAKNRIILVGDHRQLPHIIDTEIEKRLQSDLARNDDKSIAATIEKQIKESLFEHLFKTLKDVEKKDGIKRTITLDTQYRMHPVHGDFISKVFYESNDEPYIKSGLPVKVFAHKLPNLENKAAIWLKIDSHEGKEVSIGSKYRPSEAKKIAEHLKFMIDSEQGKKLNFGIITFYRAQVDEILKALLEVGITEKAESNILIKKEYAEFIINNSTKEKLRVGTVDAFQGKEFDVVYLSTVRSNNFSDKNERERIKKYGFIMSPNRLNVSMSRQKKVLIVAGDTDMLRTPNADKAVLPLIEYYKLCKESEYGTII